MRPRRSGLYFAGIQLVNAKLMQVLTCWHPYNPYSVRPNVTLMNTPICSRVTGLAGQ